MMNFFTLKKYYFFEIILKLMVIMAIFSSCRKAPLPEIEEHENTNFNNSKNDQGVVLGNKLENPYSLKNLRKAQRALYNQAKKSMAIQEDVDSYFLQPLELTDLYVRFLPKDTTQLIALSQYGSSTYFYGYPLDYEIIKEGNRYHDPSIPADQISWIYGVVKPNFKFPSDIKYEIIDSLSKPDESNELLETESLAMTHNLPADEIQNFNINLAKIMSAGNDVNPNKISGLFRRKKYYPSGTIHVYNTETGNNEPLRRMTIFVRYWFWTNSTDTDNNGYYRINERYSHEVGLYASFRSAEVTIRKGFNEWVGMWVSEKIGNRKGENQESYITPSNDTRLWQKSTVHNAVAHYADYANSYGLQPPNDVNIWLSEGNNNESTGVTVMLKGYSVSNYLYGENHINIVNELITNAILKALFVAVEPLIPSKIKPDILIGTGKNQNTSDLYQVLFHELAHYSHFYKAGGFAYWRGVAKGISNQEDYGSGLQFCANYVAVAEAWAFYMGYFLAYKRFGNTHSIEEELEGQQPVIPRPFKYTRGWIPYGALYDLYDDTPTEEIKLFYGDVDVPTGIKEKDEVKNIGPGLIYQQLTGEVTTIPLLRDKIVAAAANRPFRRWFMPNQSEQIIKLFKAYGY